MGRLAISVIKIHYKSTVIKNRIQSCVVVQAFNARTWEKEEYYHYSFEVSLDYIARLCQPNQDKTAQQ